MPNWLAIVLVMGTSAAVLVLEILAGRLLAPYVGVSLETYTGIIGIVLIGIAAGAAAGGSLADRTDPRRLLPLLLVGGGALAIATIPVVRLLGSSGGSDGGGTGRILVLTAFGFLPAATVLSAVPPAVVKLQLHDLSATGATVGRLSAFSTAGAIGGTFFTGYVLVRSAAVTTLIVAVGVALVVGGVALWLGSWRQRPVEVLGIGAVAMLALVGVTTSEPPCQTQTRYYCVSVLPHPDRPNGRTLLLDDLRHSYVDLDDPTYLEFWYVRRLVDAIDRYSPAGPLDVVYIGGGGFTMPRYLRAVRPGSEQTVLEIDGDLVQLVEERFGYEPSPDVAVVVGDGRLSMRGLPTASADVVVGDAFGSQAVPFHLTTEEFVTDIARVLRPGGLYVANVIDAGGQRFVRAEAATVARVFPNVAVVLGPGAADGFDGNSVIVASDGPLDPDELRAALRQAGEGGEVVADLDAFLRGATILTDDFAPVDQLIAAGRR